jgi:hypothetical protein
MSVRANEGGCANAVLPKMQTLNNVAARIRAVGMDAPVF